QRQVTNPIREGLKAIGIDPETVENVIVTHLHYDHAGNYELFPRARYHLQDLEMGYARPGAACAMRCCASPLKSTMLLPWCAKCSPAGLNFMMAPVRSPRASRCTGSAATRRVCNACG